MPAARIQALLREAAELTAIFTTWTKTARHGRDLKSCES
jgi:hypothetical protein